MQSYQGQDAYNRFLGGSKITRKEAMLAKCYECMGEYEDGKRDCQGVSCPLYFYYPYKKYGRDKH
jgi:hypothetical protein